MHNKEIRRGNKVQVNDRVRASLFLKSVSGTITISMTFLFIRWLGMIWGKCGCYFFFLFSWTLIRVYKSGELVSFYMWSRMLSAFANLPINPGREKSTRKGIPVASDNPPFYEYKGLCCSMCLCLIYENRWFRRDLAAAFSKLNDRLEATLLQTFGERKGRLLISSHQSQKSWKGPWHHPSSYVEVKK